MNFLLRAFSVITIIGILFLATSVWNYRSLELAGQSRALVSVAHDLGVLAHAKTKGYFKSLQ